MEEQAFLVTLIPQVPKEFLDYWEGYLGEWRGLQHFLADSVDPAFPFVEFLAIPNDKNTEPRVAYIPTNFVLSITSSPEGKRQIGFQLGNQ